MMYDEALRCAPADTTLLLSRSFAQMMSTPPRLDLALQDADAAIQHCPTSWQGWSQKGETHRRMGDIKKAEEALVNAVGCAQGMDKLTARRSLVDIQSQRGRASPTASPSSTSVQYTPTPPTPFSEHSLHTAPPSTPVTAFSHTPPVMQKPPTINPTNIILGSTETVPLNNHPLGKLTFFATLKQLVLTGINSLPTVPCSAPTAPLSHSPPVTTSSTTRPTRTTSGSVPGASNTQTSGKLTCCATLKRLVLTGIDPQVRTVPYSVPTITHSHSPPVTTSSTTRPTRTTSGSVPGASNTQTSGKPTFFATLK